jgi:hypothetical protein
MLVQTSNVSYYVLLGPPINWIQNWIKAYRLYDGILNVVS